MAIKGSATALFVLLVAVPAVYAADIIVGGSSGWTDQGVNYDTWAAGQTFRVGDNLVFNYGSNHRVDEVSEPNYKACSSSSPINSLSGGSNSVPLSAAGRRYFICPIPGHCSGGMKLQINVVAANSSPTPGATPSPPSASSPPPPSPSGAAGGFVDLKGLVFGVSVAYLARKMVAL